MRILSRSVVDPLVFGSSSEVRSVGGPGVRSEAARSSSEMRSVGVSSQTTIRFEPGSLPAWRGWSVRILGRSVVDPLVFKSCSPEVRSFGSPRQRVMRCEPTGSLPVWGRWSVGVLSRSVVDPLVFKSCSSEVRGFDRSPHRFVGPETASSLSPWVWKTVRLLSWLVVGQLLDSSLEVRPLGVAVPVKDPSSGARLSVWDRRSMRILSRSSSEVRSVGGPGVRSEAAGPLSARGRKLVRLLGWSVVGQLLGPGSEVRLWVSVRGAEPLQDILILLVSNRWGGEHAEVTLVAWF